MSYEIDRDETKEPSLKYSSNDPAAHVQEILAPNEMIQSVVEWVDKNPSTIMISVSFRKTFGFVSRQTIPSLLHYNHSPAELARINDATPYEIDYLTSPTRTSFEYSLSLAHMISDRAGLGWATTGHSAVDVNLLRMGRGQTR
ncbi:UNVERIFIED_CONTAM: hypothetical protein HDU68_012561 [Siphonaria sp. JEL0065]|nr:hypothetical protein HDU68_012561 [Siphonaria sp. JEL0065]